MQETTCPLPSVEKKEANSLSDKSSTSLFRILVVEDDLLLQGLYKRILDDTTYLVDMSCDGKEALARLPASFYDLVITELDLPGLDGITILNWLRRNRPTTTAVVISGDSSSANILAAMRDSIFGEFVQAQTVVSSCQANGLGLGLALAKDILRQHGGDIWYEAMANGSKFICTLPPCPAQSVG